MNFGLIIVGDEILSGKRRDQHLPRLIELLGARGLSLGWARYVGDDPARLSSDLRDAFAAARSQGDVVFSCGGIGATPDDHTRSCAAQALGVPLHMHPTARGFIIERMQALALQQGRVFDADDPEHIHRLNMAVFPAGADIVPNPYNKIAGFSVQAEPGAVYFLPGFPEMAWPMMEWVLDTHWAHLQTTQGVQERSVIVLNGMEGALTPLMQELEARFDGIKVFSLPSVGHPQWGLHVELGVKGQGSQLLAAYRHLLQGLQRLNAQLGPELVR